LQAPIDTPSETTRLLIQQRKTPGAARLRLGRSRLSLLSLFLRGGGGFLLSLVFLGSGTLSLVAIRRGPQSEVITQQLHDQSAVTVALLRQRVELSNGIVESLLGKVAGTVGRVQNLVVEDREVQSETKTDGVGRGEVGLGNIGSVLRRSAGKRALKHILPRLCS
jgi:hypothetical protein